MTLTALIDGDLIVHKAASGAEERIDWGDDEVTTSPDGERAEDMARELVREWMEAAGCNKCIVALSPDSRTNFRKVVLPTYKANRTVTKPVLFARVLAAMRDAFETRTVEGLEADDVLGIMHTGQYKGRSVIVSVDKDMLTIPGQHFNPAKATGVAVSERQADQAWLLQTLTGDSVDGYTGIPGIGPKKGAVLLGRYLSTPVAWLRVVRAYQAAGLTVAHALTQARVARILRREDYDKERKEILLWHPTTPIRLALETACAASAASTLTTSWAPGGNTQS